MGKYPQQKNYLSTMILPQVHLRKPCYDFSFLQIIQLANFKDCTTIYIRKLSSLQITHQHILSVGATGGVYKGQGRIQCTLMANTYWVFLVYMLKFQSAITNKESFKDFIALIELIRKNSITLLLQPVRRPGHLRASQTCYCYQLPAIYEKPVPLRSYKPT